MAEITSSTINHSARKETLTTRSSSSTRRTTRSTLFPIEVIDENVIQHQVKIHYSNKCDEGTRKSQIQYKPVSEPTCELIGAVRSSESVSNASDETSDSVNIEPMAVESSNAATDTSEPRSLTTLTMKASKSTCESTSYKAAKVKK